MDDDAVGGGVGDDFGDILVTVVSVEEVATGFSLLTALPEQRARGDWFCQIPLEDIGDGVVRAVQPLDAKIVVVNEPLVLVRGDLRRIVRVDDGLDVLDAPPHEVILHDEIRRPAGPIDRTILAVVGDGPDAGLDLDERLIAIEIVLQLGDAASRRVINGSASFLC